MPAVFGRWLKRPRLTRASESHSEPSRAVEKGLAWWHTERDPIANAQSRPPDDESIDVGCVWVSEVYLPSHLDKLVSGLRSLEWKASAMGKGENLDRWVEEAAISPLSRQWLNLGPILRVGDQRFSSDALRAPLPDIADYATGSIDNMLDRKSVV